MKKLTLPLSQGVPKCHEFLSKIQKLSFTFFSKIRIIAIIAKILKQANARLLSLPHFKISNPDNVRVKWNWFILFNDFHSIKFAQIGFINLNFKAQSKGHLRHHKPLFLTYFFDEMHGRSIALTEHFFDSKVF